MLFVVFTVAPGHRNGPAVRAGRDRPVLGRPDRPARRTLLAAAALFMVILYETGRIPVETHSGTNEFGMIEEARPFEHSGPYFALLRWGSAMKQLILYTILLNVFVAPWGLAATAQAAAVLLAIVALLAKAAVLGVVVAVIDNSFAKLRLFKITEFAAAAFLLAVLGVFTLYLGRWLMLGHGARRRGAERVLRRRHRHRRGRAADRVLDVAAGAAARPGPALRRAVRADLRAGRRGGRRPAPARSLCPGRACPSRSRLVIVPIVLRRLLRGTRPRGRTSRAAGRDIAGSGALSLASTVLIAIVVAAFGFFSVAALGIQSAGPAGHGAGDLGIRRARGVRPDDHAPGRGLPGHRLPLAGERGLADRPGRRGRPAADP